jgi:hypothetical protein
MRKTEKIFGKDLEYVRKYCLAGSFPASDDRCPYSKAKVMAVLARRLKGESDFKEVDKMFLCRYPDEKMPLHEALLVSELKRCPNKERREMIDEFYRGEV